MATYMIDPRNNVNKPAMIVSAGDHSEAARKAAMRTTGDHNKGGMFQGYTKNGEGQLNSIGAGFHVFEQ